MPTVTPPEAVLYSAVFNPVVWPNGTTYYLLKTASGHVGSAKQPKLRDAAGKPVTITEELAPGTIVQIAVGDDGLMIAVKIIDMAWDDPFADAA